MKTHTYFRVVDGKLVAVRMRGAEARGQIDRWDNTPERAIERALRERRIRSWAY